MVGCGGNLRQTVSPTDGRSEVVLGGCLRGFVGVVLTTYCSSVARVVTCTYTWCSNEAEPSAPNEEFDKRPITLELSVFELFKAIRPIYALMGI